MSAGAAVTGSLGVGVSAVTLAQPTSVPTIATSFHHRKHARMTLLLLEALGAGLIFIFIIWWTMFSGRNKGEPPIQQEDNPTNVDEDKRS
jgi:hypothetical protein